jgi:hypothetical protein
MNTRRQIITTAVLAMASATIGGCTGIAWLANAFAPPEKIEAKHELEPKGKVLVLIDDLGQPIRYEQVKRLLTEKVNRLLLENNAAEKVVAYEDVFRLSANRKDFNQMGVSNVARALGATQAIYVYLDEFSLKDDPTISLWRGKLGVTVRVVDVKGKTVWPEDRPSGHSPELSKTPEVDDPSPTYGAKVAADLADDMALKIARLFYKHTISRSHTPGTR